MRPVFLTSSSRNKLDVEIKTADFYFLHKHRYNFHICLLLEFWRFFNFRSELQSKTQARNPAGAMRKTMIRLFSRDFQPYELS